jgi:dipeptidyl aminopeptidase/acylaminoacyl peptidase
MRGSVPGLVVAVLLLDLPAAAAGMDFAHLAALRRVEEAAISPDGRAVAYVLEVPRRPGVDEDGRAWQELHVVAVRGGDSRAWVHGDVSVSAVRYAADGTALHYLAKRGSDEQGSVWSLPVGGGESRRLVEHGAEIEAFAVAPDGTRIAFVASDPESAARKAAEKKGYRQEVYEEDRLARKLWLVPAPPAPGPRDPLGDTEPPTARAIPLEGSVFDVVWSPDGRHLAVTVAPTPLVDDRYMSRRILILDAGTGEVRQRIQNPGKLGEMAFSPDGSRLALISAAAFNDPAEGRLLVASVASGGLADALPGLEADVRDIAWRSAGTLAYVLDTGVETELGEVELPTGRRTTRLRSAEGAPVLSALSVAADGGRVALVAERPLHPPEVYAIDPGETEARRLTHGNPWLAGLELARQSVFRWKARDGIELEGVLLEPASPPTDRSAAPLLLLVHGGPEAHDRNGWVTAYSRPGQLAATRGYAVLYPNYRGSTGRGVAFAKLGQADAAGAEFDDLIDAIDALAERGIADPERVGIIGGSYGGYAAAWCATRYTDRFRAAVVFVGISNVMTKPLTTDIPIEDRAVHTLSDPLTGWEESLRRSPLAHAAGSRTAVLIAAGTEDTRVDPSQSLQLYRALKLAGGAPVRYVRYPGEGHGNRKAAARDDYARRSLQWFDHFVMNRGEGLPARELELPHLAGADDADED